MKVTVISVVIGALETLFQRLGKGTRRIEIQETSGGHPDYCIIKISQNTEKSPGDLKKLAITQTPMKNH